MQAKLHGTVRVFTFKEGLLSRVAHDLRLDVGEFRIELDGDTVEAKVDANSLTVDGVMKKGRLDRNGLRKRDMAQIQRTIRDEIFQTNRFPEIDFSGQRDGSRVSGQLHLKGRRAQVSFTANESGDRWRGRFEIQPSRWGIAPYKALMGAIKLKDRVVVEFDLEAGEST